ncbi:hypothetical protein M413DRAFT_25826 [Hebeloma cylindrosporum]|uniref:Uncharacterized protein n=1 Tax=Hebeloma cylindrosporum TaxID=76867 RepID=A0A0C2Y0R9_HEBCY|nr:hypothetical protein M413DRAFT_25826 [Hebeloma cylindrosporum h7]
MARPPTQLRNNSKSPTPSDSENTPVLTADASRADLLKIARQYEADKNEAQAKLNRLSRKTRHESPPANSDEDIESSTHIASDERFVYQAGHNFFLLCAPWIRSGDDLFDTDVDEWQLIRKRKSEDTQESGRVSAWTEA